MSGLQVGCECKAELLNSRVVLMPLIPPFYALCVAFLDGVAVVMVVLETPLETSGLWYSCCFTQSLCFTQLDYLGADIGGRLAFL